MAQLSELLKLAQTVKDHIGTHGHLTSDEFDQMLLGMKLIDDVPTVTDPTRGSHTRMRDGLRKKVAHLLKQRGLTLVQSPGGRGVHTIKDAMIAGMERMSAVPSAQERLAIQALNFTGKVWKNQASDIAKLLPEDKAELWRKEVEYQAHRQAHDMQRALWFIVAGSSIDWPDALKASLPEEPPPFRLKRPRRRRA